MSSVNSGKLLEKGGGGKVLTTAWQWSLSGVHSIMRVKSAQHGEGGGCMPSPFHSIYHHE
jgi:hypothetical protein